MQFSDNLTKVYKSHTFKGGCAIPEHLLRLDPAALRARRVLLGRPLHVAGQLTDNSTSRALPADADSCRWSLAASTSAACTPSVVSPFGDVDAFKTYHGAYAQDSWRASNKLTLNYWLRWDWFSREQELQESSSSTWCLVRRPAT